MGATVVFPWTTPPKKVTVSVSNFMRPERPKPWLRCCSSRCIESTERERWAGIPSRIQTSSLPCDSPAVCKRSFCHIGAGYSRESIFRKDLIFIGEGQIESEQNFPFCIHAALHPLFNTIDGQCRNPGFSCQFSF